MVLNAETVRAGMPEGVVNTQVRARLGSVATGMVGCMPGCGSDCRNRVGELALSTSGEWTVRPPQRCGNGHLLTPGHVLVGSMVCACGERQFTWLCDCGYTSYGPPLGVSCSILDGPAAVQ